MLKRVCEENMDRLSEEQSRRNKEADATWALYEPHRRRVTQLLLNARSQTQTQSSAPSRACLLGAGNLNDFDLSALMTVFAELIVIDVDVESLQRGLVRQGFSGDRRIQVVAPADVTGIFADLSSMQPGQPANAELIERC